MSDREHRATPASDSVISCHQLVKVYRGAAEEVQAVRGVDLTLAQGTLSAVLGPSGSGKSTLIRLISGLDRPSAGSIVHRGVILTDLTPRALRRWRARSVAFVHQRPRSNLVEHVTVRDHIELARSRRRLPRVDPVTVLDSVGLAEHAGRLVDQLSGGEQQRLALAAAITAEPDVLVADEPTAHLDDGHAHDVLRLLRKAARDRGTTVVYTTHDPRVTDLADRLLHLEYGVLTTEHKPGSSGRLGVIDASGRVQLPAEARELFPGSRVVIEVVDGHVVLRRPPS